jgi:hypothetical protein
MAEIDILLLVLVLRAALLSLGHLGLLILQSYLQTLMPEIQKDISKVLLPPPPAKPPFVLAFWVTH